MKKIYLLLVTALFFVGHSYGQITIAGSTGTANGTYTSFTNAGGAFAALNTGGSHNAGDVITISITGDVTSEAGTTGLNAGTWTSITITPSGTRTISGSVAMPLIDLNGADNITIDGLNTGGNSLTISNLSTSATSGTSTIRLINGATNNTFTNCNLQGSMTMAVATNGGIIYFATDGTTANGNDNNTVSNCNISAAGSNLPTKGIYMNGSTTTTAIGNSGNVFNNNNIFDFFGAAVTSAGVYISTGNTDNNITNNKFYQTGTRTQTTGSQHSAIWIATTSGNNFVVTGNIIGYASAASTGTYNFTGIASSTLFPIFLNIGNTTASSVQNNTITAINYTRSGTAITTAPGIFSAINVAAGLLNIGTTTGNTIGAATGTGAITINSATLCNSYGIYLTSANGAAIQNNSIGSITVTSSTATIGQTFQGISVAGSGSHTITFNTIGSTTTSNSISVGTAGVTTGATTLAGIVSAATGTTVSIGNTAGTGNVIQNISSVGASGTSQLFAIQNTGAAATLNIRYNNISNLLFSGTGTTSTTMYTSSIMNTGAVSSALNITNNSASSTTLSATSYGGVAGFIISTAGGSSSTVTIQNNYVTSYAYTGSTGGTSTFYGIYYVSTVSSLNVSSNNFDNLTLKTSGAVILCYLNSMTTNVTASGNIITTQLSRPVSSGNSLIGMFNVGGSSGVSSGTHTVSNNVFSNITGSTTSATTTGVVGILWQPGVSATSAPAVNITGNTTLNYNNTTGATGSPITGIYADWSTNLTISNNTIGDLLTNGATAFGIQSLTLGATGNIYKNKIYNISTTTSTTGVATGIMLGTAGSSTTLTYNISNNLIGGMVAPSASGTNQAIGINVAGGAVCTYNFYYNTIYLNATGGANFGSSAILASVTPTVVLRNNIFSNLSTPSGTGFTVAYRRSAGAAGNLSTYGSASNNNLFYAGIPGTGNLIYSDGTSSAQTLAAYKAGVFTAGTVAPRDAASVTENPPFLSVTGSAATFLHIDPTVATQIESGAVNISGYTTDYDNDIRQGNAGYLGTSTSGTDIGADEGEFILSDVSGPVITYTALANTACATAPVFSPVNITDISGVNVTTGTKPRVYYKKSTDANTYAGNTSADNGWKYVEATNASTPFSFTFDYSLLTSTVAAGDNIQYFVVAQDNVIPTPNISINSGVFAAAPASVALTAAQFPITGTINSFTILVPIANTVTIGATGTYPSLTGAGGLFAAINSGAIAGNTVATIIDASVTETGANALLQMNYGCAGPFTLTIKPNAAGTILTGALNSSALVKVLSSNVIIDGSSNGSSSQDLTIINTSTTTPNVILFGSTGTTAITNSAIKNCIITNGINTSTPIVVSDGSTLGSAGYFTNITIQNNDIRKGYVGVYAIAATVAGNGNGLNIAGNTLNATGTNAISHVGLYVQGVDGATLQNNIIANFDGTGSEDDLGIWLATGTTNTTVSGNKIYNIAYTGTGGYGAYGLEVSTGLSNAGITVKNNMIAGISADGFSYTNATYALDNPFGILLYGTQTGINLYYNSINLYGNTLNQSNAISAGIYLAAGSVANIKDNIIVNNLGRSGSSGYGAVAIYAATGSSQFASSNYNDYYVSPTGGGNKYIGQFNTTGYATLANWAAATTQDANSLNVLPVFTSNTDLHLTAANNCGLDGYGTPIAGITTDYDAQARDADAPDMGADEFNATYSTTLAAASYGTTASVTKTVSASGTTYVTPACELLAKVVPAGASPVTGSIKVAVTRDPSSANLFFNAEPYLTRHYDVEPATNAGTATATLTMYYTDQEFSDYNTNNPLWPAFPTVAGGGNSDPNIANVKVTQYHGTPTTTPSSPGNYTLTPGIGVSATPVSVNYNGTSWEVTVPVAGFSGFYVYSSYYTAPLPITLNYLRGTKQGTIHNLNWSVTCNTTPTATLTLERSSNGRDFTGINTITATALRCQQPFDYADVTPLAGINYYRLKMTDANGKFTYSNVVTLINATKGLDVMNIAPNPVTGPSFKLNVSSAKASPMVVIITDMQGRVVSRQPVNLTAGFNSLDMRADNLAAGTYNVYGTTADDKTKVIRFVKN